MFLNQEFIASSPRINNKKWNLQNRRFLFFRDNIIQVIILTKSKSLEYFVIFSIGGLVYGLVEVVTRGYTHWTMILTGGTAFLLIHLVNMNMKNRSILLRCLAGCGIITTLEFIVGCIVNRMLHMNVWDYSGEKFNLLGQICPLFSMMWFLICIPAVILSFLLKKNLR